MLFLLPSSISSTSGPTTVDLVILNLGSIHGLNQLAAVHTGTVELNLHVTTTDDLTLECGCECNRDIDIGDLDLNVTCFKRGSIEFAYVFLYDQALRYAEEFSSLVITGKPRAIAPAPQATITGSSGAKAFTNAGTRFMVYSIRAASVARSYVTKDQSRTDCYRYNVDNRGYIFTKRDNTYVSAGLHASLSHLIDDAAYQSYQNTLCLIGSSPEPHASSTEGAEPRITATPGISPVTRGTPSSRITASARCP